MFTALVQARMGSTRLPGKVLMPILGIPMLGIMVDRVARAKLVDQTVVVTTTNSSDDQIVSFCKLNNIKCYRGSEQDVLARYFNAAVSYKASHIVRLTADCPLIDPKIIDLVIQKYLSEEVDYVANTAPPPGSFPDGMDVEVFSFSALENAHKMANLPSEREHVTFHFWKSGKFKTLRVENVEDLSKLRLTVDYDKDFETVCRIFEALEHLKNNFGLEEIMELYMKNTSLFTNQTDFERNSGWQESLNSDLDVIQHSRKED